MIENCLAHLISELRILRPEMVVFHGIESLKAARRGAFKQFNIDLIADNECSYGDGPALYCSRDLGAHILFLYHPALQLAGTTTACISRSGLATYGIRALYRSRSTSMSEGFNSDGKRLGASPRSGFPRASSSGPRRVRWHAGAAGDGLPAPANHRASPAGGAVSTDQAVSQSSKLTLTPISRMWASASLPRRATRAWWTVSSRASLRPRTRSPSRRRSSA